MIIWCSPYENTIILLIPENNNGFAGVQLFEKEINIYKWLKSEVQVYLKKINYHFG